MSPTTLLRPSRLRRRVAATAASLLISTGLVAVAAPSAHAVQPGRTTAYVTNNVGKAVSVVDTTTGATTASVPVAGYAQDVVVNRAGTTAYAATAFANTVAVIDTATSTVAATVPLAGFPTAVAVNNAGTAVYVADSGAHAVEIIDTATNTVSASVPVAGNHLSLALSPSGATAYVTTFSPNALVVIDTATAAVTATVPVAGTPYGAVVNPAGTAVYVGLGGGSTIAKIDTATNTLTASIAAANTTALSISPDGSTLYGSSPGNHGVYVVDTTTNTVTTFVGGLGNIQDVQVNSTGTTVYAVDPVNPSGTVPGNLYAIDTATNTGTTAATGLNSPSRLALHTVPAPEITAVTPNSGPIAGGTAVTITGTDLNGATAITFGTTPATGITCTATSCSATAPAHAAGTVDVQVTTPGGTSTLTPADQYTYVLPPAADIDVNVTAQPHLGILVPYLTYTLTAHNTGPDPVTSATVTATLPPGASATNLPAGCTSSTGTVTCTYGSISNTASASKSFRVPLHLLSLGPVKVTGTRTASAPTDSNPANDSASATCTVISIILATCP
ncbi:IPT/TIG domain-containing protein [Streptomyces subrutilus]|uniref:IPT/TIG domain-containing protein n=1 Tax=Streptomyces subrutilus TaxID=36818 RepID=A0A1E5PKH8_9ACTN|nr:IPT/TIG domain-containing protein [Streptomyces subrutilus]OEJ30045.1 hypothetical protein BGK67_00375 [Streptomyces subrutilus]